MTEPLYLDDDDLFAVVWTAAAEARAALAVSRAALRAVAALAPETRQAADAALLEEIGRSAWLDPRASRRVRELLDDIRAELQPTAPPAGES